MSLTPITRDSMRSLKAEEDENIRIQAEKSRLQRLNSIISQIYASAIKIAKTSKISSYQHQWNHMIVQESGGVIDNFYEVNKTDILDRLRDLFPDCTVLYTETPQSPHRSYYNKSSIIIDWS